MKEIMTPGGRVEIVPSLLAADLSCLGEQLRLVRSAGVRWVSLDVMDGHFVDNLSFGPDFVRMIKREEQSLFVDAHLMVDNPEKVAPYFIDAGADMVTVHYEAAREPEKLLRAIKSQGARAGMAVKPKTGADVLLPFLGQMDLALVMTVEPGFGGAKFLGSMLAKLKILRQAIRARGVPCWLQADGGINRSTAPQAAQAGADSLVAGTSVFRAENVPGEIQALRQAAQEAFEKNQGAIAS